MTLFLRQYEFCTSGPVTYHQSKNLTTGCFAVDNDKQIHKRFANLEELYLDNNHLCDLSTFATLGALKK